MQKTFLPLNQSLDLRTVNIHIIRIQNQNQNRVLFAPNLPQSYIINKKGSVNSIRCKLAIGSSWHGVDVYEPWNNHFIDHWLWSMFKLWRQRYADLWFDQSCLSMPRLPPLWQPSAIFQMKSQMKLKWNSNGLLWTTLMLHKKAWIRSKQKKRMVVSTHPRKERHGRWCHRYSSSRMHSWSWRRKCWHRYMSGSALSGNVGFPSASLANRLSILSPDRASARNHAFDFLFAHFNIFNYPGNNLKIHGRKIKQETLSWRGRVLAIESWTFLKKFLTDLVAIMLFDLRCKSEM